MSRVKHQMSKCNVTVTANLQSESRKFEKSFEALLFDLVISNSAMSVTEIDGSLLEGVGAFFSINCNEES